MEINNNTPNYNFISLAIKENNHLIKENILLGNIHFPEKIEYTPEILLQSESHSMFVDNLLNKLNLAKIKEEKQILNEKIEMSNNRIKSIKNNHKIEINTKNNNNFLPLLNVSNILPTKKEKTNKNQKNNENTKRNLLIEIKPLPNKKSNQLLIDKLISKENEYDLEQNAKEFIRKINNYNINNIALKKQKQKRDLLRLKQEIEIAEKRKQREEYELQKLIEERKQQNILKRNKYKNYYNSPPRVKYHYYNSNSSAKKRNKMLKNLSYILNNNEYNYQYYNNNVNNFNNPYMYPNINQYQQINVNNYIESERRNTENTGPIVKETHNNSNMVYREQNNYSIINESRTNNNSILNTSEKKHLYYFNDLKYEN